MKKLLLIAALTSLSLPAFASKARLNSLGYADHLVDTQTVFDNPAHLNWLPDYATFEGGPTTSAFNTATQTAASLAAAGVTWSALTNPSVGAEGGFTQSSGDAKWGVYLGRKNSFLHATRLNMGFLGMENTLELQYAMKGPMAWGVALNYANSDKKTTQQKANSAGLRVGAATDMWEAYALIGLGAKADGNTATTSTLVGDFNGDNVIDTNELASLAADTGSTLKSTTGAKLGGAYKMDNIRIFGKYVMDGYKYESAVAGNTAYNGLKTEVSQLDLGVLDVTKMDSGHWFYGASYQMYTFKQSITAGEIKTSASYLPFIAGLEYDAASWLTVRGSVTQNVLLGSVKNDDGTGFGGTLGTYVDETDTVKNNTKVAAGMGIKLNKWMVDGSWTAASSATGAMNFNSFLTNVALTYNF